MDSNLCPCRGGKAPHTNCCIICRDYAAIDDAAKKYTIQKILEKKYPDDKTDQSDWVTIRDYFQGQKQLMEEAIKKNDEGLTFEMAKVKLDEMEAAGKVKFQELQDLRALRNELAAGHEKLVNGQNKAVALISAEKNNEKKQKLTNTYERIVAMRKDVAKRLEKVDQDLAIAEKAFKQSKLDFDVEQKKQKNRADPEKAFGQDCLALVQRLANSLFRRSNLAKTDTIGCARFFFTWIAHSIKYDKSVESLAVRVPIVTILSGTEICAGYSKLFNAMFDAVCDFKTVFISGRTRSSAIGTLPEEASHGWSAFPIVQNGKDISYKIIDCTWGAGNVGDVANVEFRPWWFTKPNNQFAITHVPEDKGHLYWDNDVAPSLPKFFPFESVGSVTIDVFSVQPSAAVLKRGLTTFSYGKCCPDFKLDKMSTFMLDFGKKGTQHQFEYNRFVWFAKDPKTDLWSVTIDLNDYGDYDEVTLYSFVWSNSPANVAKDRVGIAFRAYDLQVLQEGVKAGGVNNRSIISWGIDVADV